jgi:hypothetical protein
MERTMLKQTNIDRVFIRNSFFQNATDFYADEHPPSPPRLPAVVRQKIVKFKKHSLKIYPQPDAQKCKKPRFNFFLRRY